MLEYMSGFENTFETESLPGALPEGRNNPQRCSYGLYAEQLTGSAFTAPRSTNARIWLYRIRPSVRHNGKFTPVEYPDWRSAPHVVEHGLALGPLRWGPTPFAASPTTFLEGVRTMTTSGDVTGRSGMAVNTYVFNVDMDDSYFVNADAEMLFVPETGALEIFSEAGVMHVEPLEIAVVPRGMMFKVRRADGSGEARGFVCENYGARLTLPERGPIGGSGLANARDFKTPVAAYEDLEHSCQVCIKWCGSFHKTEIDHSPLDVVAWHGNLVPYKYGLDNFSPIGSIGFDHPDPSIFTVLTSASAEPGTANLDFVIFPPRWMVAEGTFRPPWYHRNVMSEFMGMLHGKYDAKEEGFAPGAMSLHNMMLPHGPDADGFERASTAELEPVKLRDTMAFMFETRLPQQLTQYAASLDTLDSGYTDCWSGLTRKFNGTPDGID